MADIAEAPLLLDGLERHRTELVAYCYRMLGSPFEAEDAVQETFVRAWRSADRFEGRSTLRTWLYRIATNVCLDMLRSARRRARPMDLGPAAVAPSEPGPQLDARTWVEPAPDARVLPDSADPAELAEQRETIRLALVAALQYLPPRQRAVLILREVLRWPALDVAGLLETTVASVNSALQRARATVAARAPSASDTDDPTDDGQRRLLARYQDAFERYDMAELTRVLREDAVQSMPPYALWLRGSREIVRWMLGPGAGCRGSRLVPTAANGTAAFGQYRPGPHGGHEPWGLHVVETSGGLISRMTVFLDTDRWFPLFGLPPRLER